MSESELERIKNDLYDIVDAEHAPELVWPWRTNMDDLARYISQALAQARQEGAYDVLAEIRSRIYVQKHDPATVFNEVFERIQLNQQASKEKQSNDTQ